MVDNLTYLWSVGAGLQCVLVNGLYSQCMPGPKAPDALLLGCLASYSEPCDPYSDTDSCCDPGNHIISPITHYSPTHYPQSFPLLFPMYSIIPLFHSSPITH